ncbi:hypothetical protein B0H19DRAFT_1194033, partial [Mycena capillaripes]
MGMEGCAHPLPNGAASLLSSQHLPHTRTHPRPLLQRPRTPSCHPFTPSTPLRQRLRSRSSCVIRALSRQRACICARRRTGTHTPGRR